MGTPEESKSFVISITIIGKDEQELISTIGINSIDLTPEEVIQTGNVFEFSTSVGNKFKSQDKLVYKAELKLRKNYLPKAPQPDATPVELLNCPFSDHGCTLQFEKFDLLRHKIHCNYREVPCITYSCQKRITLSKVKEHLEEKHSVKLHNLPIQKLKSSIIVAYRSSSSWTLGPIACFGKDFYLTFYRSHQEEMWYILVFMIGSQEEASPYLFTVRLNPDSKVYEQFNSIVTSMDTPLSEAVKIGSVCCFTDFNVKRWTIDGKLHYHLNIKDLNSKIP